MNTPVITADMTIQASSAPLSAEIDGEVVLMSVDHGSYFGLNSVASDIWKRLSVPFTVSDLCDGLAQSYAGNRDEIERDVLEILTEMAKRDLIIVRDSR